MPLDSGLRLTGYGRDAARPIFVILDPRGISRMRQPVIAATLVLAAVATAAPASAARIIVTVDGVRDSSGNVYIGLYSNPREFLNGTHCTAYYKVKATTAPITVAFDHLPSGTYAVGAYHDENANGTIDTSAFGQPVEGYALSNGVRAMFAVPEFYQAAFAVGSGDKPVTLNIRYP
jgi:uncharacterized protein (DUF2141 family)